MTATTPTAEKAVARLAVALGHPVRIRILDALASSPSSATRLEQRLGDLRNTAYYHLQVLEKLGVIEVDGTRQVRGATESTFRLRPRASWGKLWEVIPLPVLSGWRSAAFRQFVDVALAALNTGSLDDREQTTFTASPIRLDRRGLGEVNEAVQETLKTVEQVERASRRRLARNPEGEVSAVVAAAVFESAPEQAGFQPEESDAR